MFKKGFTLAEILIALTAIGVIVAITLPTFVSNTTRAQIGPKLGKAVAMLEQANKALLDEYNVDTLPASGLVTRGKQGETNDGKVVLTVITSRIEDGYIPALRNHLNIDENGITKDGTQYTFEGGATMLGMSGFVKIDINGLAGPDKDATDIFYFSLWDNGTLVPQGATNWEGGIMRSTGVMKDSGGVTNKFGEIKDMTAPMGATDQPGGRTHWDTQCPVGEVPKNPAYCAGHIFANNMKVLYK